VNPWLQEKTPFLSIANIYSILGNLKGSDSPIVDRLIAELGKRDQQEYTIVDYDSRDESTIYRYADPATELDPVLDACINNHSRLKFEFNYIVKRFKDQLQQ